MSTQAEDEAYHAEARREMSSGAFRRGIWANALVEAKGDKSQATQIYIRERVAMLKEEEQRAEAEEASRRRSAVAVEMLMAFPQAKNLPQETVKRLATRFAAGENITGDIESEIRAKRTRRAWIALFIGIGLIGFIVFSIVL
jgi:hypothetical protein